MKNGISKLVKKVKRCSAFTYSEHLCAACWASALYSWFAIFESCRGCALDLSLTTALYTISYCHVPY